MSIRGFGLSKLLVFLLCWLTCSIAAAELRLASWNIQNLGWNNDKSYEAVARVASQFDFIAIQELMNEDGLTALVDELETKTNESWGTMFSAPLGTSRYREKYAFIWREGVIEYVDGAVLHLDDREQFAREPYSARFYAPELDLNFIAATVHITYGERVTDRTPEVRALAAYWEWLADIYPEDRNQRILFGDFNLQPHHAAWAPLWEIAQPLITEGATTLSTHDRQYANLYDNIIIPNDHNLPITGAGISKYPELLTQTTPHYWSHAKARAHVSDHAPVYLLLGNAALHPMNNGELHVPNRSNATQTPTAELRCIDINTASAERLEALPHIGPARAEAIIAGRPWAGYLELIEISGITRERVREMVGEGVLC